MAIMIETKRTGFFSELSPALQNEYLGLKSKKFLPTVDNLYFSAHIVGDGGDETIYKLSPFLQRLEQQKEEASRVHEPIPFDNDLLLTLKSYSFYRYCLTESDLYDIFICHTLPNDDTPRIVVQLRALGLWTRGVDEVISEAYSKIEALLKQYNCTIDRCRESRIDYCYHTNAISSPDKIFKETGCIVKHLHTNLGQATYTADLEHVEAGTVLHKDYVCFGRKQSNNVRARVYDKVKEVIELGYKDFFFKLWNDNGLISYYDKWCMEYAFPFKNMDYLAKARLAFYVEHGVDEARRKIYSKALSSPNTTLADFKRMANEYMPKTTAVINIEYETKRKFYYYSDAFIDGFKVAKQRNIPKPLERIYKILDNKGIFLDYLTSKTLAFYSGKDENGTPKYLAWWNRLRNTKLGGIKADEKLLRDYTYEMDKKAVQKRAINAVASAAVYDDNLETDFVVDLSDFLADVSDNQSHKMGLFFMDENGGIVDRVYSPMLGDYLTTKAKKEMLLKNRKKRVKGNIPAIKAN